MRVLLISEGTHEGHLAEENPQALRALVRRVLPVFATYEWRSVLELPRGNPFPGKGGGHFKLAPKALKFATDKSIDGLVLVRDADTDHERIKQFDEAQVTARFPSPRALGIAVEAFDAWILADHQGLTRDLNTHVSLLQVPELFTGPKNSSRHPKQVCRSLIQDHGWPESQAVFYEAVCACADLDFVAQRCPKGFKPFLDRLRLLALNVG